MFDLTEPSRSGRSARPGLAVGGDDGLRLDRVAEGRAGAVRLDRVDLGRGSVPRRQRGADHRHLRRAGSARSARCSAPSWLTRRAADDREHGGLRRAAKALQHQQPAALRPTAVGGGRERLAAAVATARAAAELHEHVRAWPAPTPPGQRERRSRRAATPDRPGGWRPARTSRRCRRSWPARAGPGRTRCGPRRRSGRRRSTIAVLDPAVTHPAGRSLR